MLRPDKENFVADDGGVILYGQALEKYIDHLEAQLDMSMKSCIHHPVCTGSANCPRDCRYYTKIWKSDQ